MFGKDSNMMFQDGPCLLLWGFRGRQCPFWRHFWRICFLYRSWEKVARVLHVCRAHLGGGKFSADLLWGSVAKAALKVANIFLEKEHMSSCEHEPSVWRLIHFNHSKQGDTVHLQYKSSLLHMNKHSLLYYYYYYIIIRAACGGID